MGKLRSINYFVAFLLLLMASTGLRSQYNNAQTYGWKYNQTTIIETIIGDNVIETEIVTEISIITQIYATVFIGLMGILLLANNRAIVGYTLDIIPIKPGESSGIKFIGIEPEEWDVGYAPRERIIDVTMDENRVEIPIMLILKWAAEHGLIWNWEIDLEEML